MQPPPSSPLLPLYCTHPSSTFVNLQISTAILIFHSCLWDLMLSQWWSARYELDWLLIGYKQFIPTSEHETQKKCLWFPQRQKTVQAFITIQDPPDDLLSSWKKHQSKASLQPSIHMLRSTTQQTCMYMWQRVACKGSSRSNGGSPVTPQCLSDFSWCQRTCRLYLQHMGLRLFKAPVFLSVTNQLPTRSVSFWYSFEKANKLEGSRLGACSLTGRTTLFLPACSQENGVWNILLWASTSWMGHSDVPNCPVVPAMQGLLSVPLSHKPYNLQEDALKAYNDTSLEYRTPLRSG
jgi:hypothetical protein